MSPRTAPVTKLAFVILLQVGADIISDITSSETDETSALQVKAELFWKPILNAAEEVQMEKHLQVYAEVEEAIKKLPTENEYVRQTLREALDHLKSADDASFKQALASKNVATEKLDVPCDTSGSGFSFLTGGQNFLKTAYQRFVGGGHYPDKLFQHIEQRQADILPVLRGAAGVTGSILSDCRLASKKGFDVRKYDLYNKGVPKTPQFADDAADRIIDAAGETRHRFTKSITDMVNGIARDVQEREEQPAATVTKASVKGLHAKIVQAEREFGSKRSIRSEKPLLSSSASQIIDL